MYVIIVGAGEVGSYVAERLSREGVDVAVIEGDAARLRALEEELDVLTVRGSGSHPDVLALAGLPRADLLVAVTNQDEVNMVASMVAKQAGVERTVVRLEAPGLRGEQASELRRLVDADLIIDPDEEAARDIVELLEFPGASEVEALAAGEVLVIGARLAAESPVVGQTLLEVARDHEPEWEFLFGTITRGAETIIPRGDHRLMAGDQVRVLCMRKARRGLMRLLGLARRIPKRVMLLGGGRTAELVAERLARRGTEVVIVERDPQRARQLAEDLRHVTVLQGDFTETDVLVDAEVGEFDAVAALGGQDDANILACLFAKSQGAAETLAIAHRLELLPLLKQAGIDASLSPRTATANAVLRFVRGNIAGVATFLEGQVEVLEYEVRPGSAAAGSIIAELRIPHDVLIGAVVRDGRAEIARGRSELVVGDHVVVFTMPDTAGEVSKLFS